MAEVDELREACAEAARLGGAILREKWGQARTVELKGGIDLVTDADRASEQALIELLSRRFPGAAILAEESGASGRGAGTTVQRLDGSYAGAGALAIPRVGYLGTGYPGEAVFAFVRSDGSARYVVLRATVAGAVRWYLARY